MPKTEDDKTYKRGVTAGQEGNWFFDMVHNVTSTVTPGRHAEIFQKGYEWGTAHRLESRSEERSTDKELTAGEYSSLSPNGSHPDLSAISRNGAGSVLAFVYLGSIAVIWIWYFVLSFQLGSPGLAIERVQSVLTQPWSPTADSVLNFIIDSFLVVAYALLLIGMLISAFYLLVVAICLAVLVFVIMGLLELSKVSPTGAVVSVILGIALFYLAWKILVKMFRRGS